MKQAKADFREQIRLDGLQVLLALSVPPGVCVIAPRPAARTQFPLGALRISSLLCACGRKMRSRRPLQLPALPSEEQA